MAQDNPLVDLANKWNDFRGGKKAAPEEAKREVAKLPDAWEKANEQARKQNSGKASADPKLGAGKKAAAKKKYAAKLAKKRG